MQLSEKAAYIKGLLDGLELDPNDKQTKIFRAISKLLCEMAEEIGELEQCYDDVSDKIDGIDEELAGIEATLDYELDGGNFEGDFDGDAGADGVHYGSSVSNIKYEVTCPGCGRIIGLTENSLNEGGMLCPECGELLEFDYDEDELDEKTSESDADEK